jgi:hypothetical protein
MSEDQIVEQVAQIMSGHMIKHVHRQTGHLICTCGDDLGIHDYDLTAAMQTHQARRVVQGLGLHEEHAPEWCGHPSGPDDDGHEPARTRLVTDWQEDTG